MKMIFGREFRIHECNIMIIIIVEESNNSRIKIKDRSVSDILISISACMRKFGERFSVCVYKERSY